jgi:hypothetical protein
MSALSRPSVFLSVIVVTLERDPDHDSAKLLRCGIYFPQIDFSGIADSFAQPKAMPITASEIPRF